jgi:chromosome segregation ATPase
LKEELQSVLEENSVFENQKEQWMQKEREILEGGSVVTRELEVSKSEIQRLKEELQFVQERTAVLESEKEQWAQKERDILEEKKGLSEANELSKIEMQKLNEELQTAQETKTELDGKLSKLSKYLEEKREEYIRCLQEKDKYCLALSEDAKALRTETDDLKNKLEELEKELQISKDLTSAQVFVLYLLFFR